MSDMTSLTVGPDEADNPIFGQFLCDLRTAKRLSRTDASLRIGVTSEYIRLIERGKRSPALGTAIKMFDMYKVPYTLNLTQLIFENTSVNFVSRIKEARHNDLKVPTGDSVNMNASEQRIAELEDENFKLREQLAKIAGGSDTISIESGVNKALEGFITLSWGAEVTQMSPTEARQHALFVLEGAESAESDAAILRAFSEQNFDREVAFTLLHLIRTYRNFKKEEPDAAR